MSVTRKENNMKPLITAKKLRSVLLTAMKRYDKDSIADVEFMLVKDASGDEYEELELGEVICSHVFSRITITLKPVDKGE